MEAPETFITIKRWWLLRFRDDDREETKNEKRSWFVPLAALGLLVIVIGIVVETYAEDRVSYFDGLWRNHASEMITEAEDHAAQLDKSTQQLKTEEANARRDAEREKLQRVQIEASVAWRRLSGAQQSEMGKRLSRQSPGVVSIWFLPGDGESSNFAGDLTELLRKANLQVIPPRALQSTQSGPGSTADPIERWQAGVHIGSTSDPRSIALANAVYAELHRAGFDVWKDPTDTAQFLAKELGPNVMIGAGSRPNGPQGEAKLRAQRIKTSGP